MPELAVILVNYNRPLDTIACIQSLNRSTFTDFATYVVDNGSGNESTQKIRTACPNINLMAYPANLGFPKANNVAMEQALQDGARFFLLLNNDTVVDASCLKELMDAIRSHPSAGIVGGKVLYYDRPDIVWFAGGILNEGSGKARHAGIGRKDDGSFDAMRSVDFITGCSLLLRRAVFESIGGLDTDYFAYYEDSDYCLRARRAHFDVLYAPRARVFHKVSSSFTLDGPMYIYFTLRNRLLFLRKNVSPLRVIPFLPALIYFYGRHLARLCIRFRGRASLKAAWFGLIDGLRGFVGENGRGRVDEVL